jgi:predicted transcriptional regulator
MLEVARELPEDATLEEAMERLYFLAKVERGLRQAETGNTVEHNDATRRLLG